MATLRASAFTLNGMLLLIGLFIVATDGLPNKPGEMIVFALLFAAPIVSIITIGAISRRSITHAA